MRLAICCASVIAGVSLVVEASPAWRGLDVDVENLPAGTRVNGVAIATTRIVGPDVPAFATRLERQWTTEPGSVIARWTVVGPWRVLSRAKGPLSEVLQLPDRYGAREALLSQIDLSVRPVPAPVSALRLPKTCKVTNTVHSTSADEVTLQLVAFCRAPATVVAQQLRSAALAGHLRELGSPSPLFGEWQSDKLHISAVISPRATSNAGQSTLVLQQQRGAR